MLTAPRQEVDDCRRARLHKLLNEPVYMMICFGQSSHNPSSTNLENAFRQYESAKSAGGKECFEIY
jgi:hypothetical protein